MEAEKAEVVFDPKEAAKAAFKRLRDLLRYENKHGYLNYEDRQTRRDCLAYLAIYFEVEP